MLWFCEGDGRANEARSINVFALTNARSQGLLRPAPLRLRADEPRPASACP